MSAAKDHINQLVSSLPEDSSFDEIVREIAFARMVEKGLADSRAHRTISNEEMSRRIKLWQKLRWTEESEFCLKDNHDLGIFHGALDVDRYLKTL